MLTPDSLAGLVARGRAAAAAMAVDTCRITAPVTAADQMPDPVTLRYDDTLGTVVYEGSCWIPRNTASAPSTQDGGEAAWAVGEYPLSLPVQGSEDVRVGCTVTYLTSAADPALAGRVYGITAVARQTHATARRFRMKQVVGGGSS